MVYLNQTEIDLDNVKKEVVRNLSNVLMSFYTIEYSQEKFEKELLTIVDPYFDNLTEKMYAEMITRIVTRDLLELFGIKERK